MLKEPGPFQESFTPAGQPYLDIEFDLAAGRVRLPASMEIDLGGIAKGWIVEKASNLLRLSPQPVRSAQEATLTPIGIPSTGSSWEVELEIPKQPRSICSSFVCRPMLYSHLFDCKTNLESKWPGKAPLDRSPDRQPSRN